MSIGKLVGGCIYGPGWRIGSNVDVGMAYETCSVRRRLCTPLCSKKTSLVGCRCQKECLAVQSEVSQHDV
ncbi:hypothetical protein IG631_20844 [Alternaria alternata]|nr:hypothetical protein IG631_20844 [Alternaria alternata]